MIKSDYIKQAIKTDDSKPLDSQIVCYRTIAAGVVSHIHKAVQAGEIVWGGKQVLGKVYDWAAVV